MFIVILLEWTFAMYYAVNLFSDETPEQGHQRDDAEHKMGILPTAVVATFGFSPILDKTCSPIQYFLRLKINEILKLNM